MGFNADFLQELRSKVPISKIIATKVKFDNRRSHGSRGEFWGCCPFHSEQTPSFHCEDNKGFYYCFGCHAKGDHFRFLMELDGLTFVQAVEKVANIGGISLPKQDPQIVEKLQKSRDLMRLMDLAAKFFEDNLHFGQLGQKARDYLANRQINIETQRIFRLGYAPADSSAILNFLLGHGFKLEDMLECGLVKITEDSPPVLNNAYCFFRDRIMFPILDVNGKVVAFGGRALWDGARAKYLNSPETRLFSKGKLLYNFSNAKTSYLQQERLARNSTVPLLVVEGYMDVVKLVQAGFGATVAVLGTALTPEHLQLLWSVNDTPILCFDGDNAGQVAALRGLEVGLPLLSTLNSLNFCFLPDGYDPDDFIAKFGQQGFMELLSKVKGVLDVIWEAELAKKPVNRPEIYANLRHRIYNKLNLIQDKSLKYYYYSDIKVRLDQLWQANYQVSSPSFVNNQPYGKPPYKSYNRGRYNNYVEALAPSEQTLSSNLVAAAASDKLYIPNIEATIFAIILTYPQWIKEFYQEFVNLRIQTPQLCQLRESLLDIVMESVLKEGDTLVSLLSEKGNEALIRRLVDIAAKLGYSGSGAIKAEVTIKAALATAFASHNQLYPN